ncbi:hypothetical protein AB0O34_12210 [Sphaerisporangium sp. NPDC088356]|uniref:hypothetical protein n=2 Tax=Streptosporangiaceae TaxID=2004 RepID=UPI003438D17F
MSLNVRGNGTNLALTAGRVDGMSFDRHLAEIAREFPDWTIWRSDAGRWWATRHHPLTEEERDAGCAMTIDADDPEGLRERLLEQQECMSSIDRET